MKTYEKWAYIEWNQNGDNLRARVVDIYIEPVVRTIDEREYDIKPDIDHPAYLVETDDKEEYIVNYHQISPSDDQNLPVNHDNHEHMKEEKHTY